MNDRPDATEIQKNSDSPSLETLLSMIQPQNESTSPTEKNGNDLLSGLLSNPEMLSRLPAMIETVKPLLQNMAPTKPDTVRKEKSEADRRTALLMALKPYMSKSRCDAIDYIIKICGITEMFK